MHQGGLTRIGRSQMATDTDPAWITVKEAAALEGVRPQLIYRRCMPSYPAKIVYKETPKGRLVDLRSLSPEAHKAWLLQQAKLAYERCHGPGPLESDARVRSLQWLPPLDQRDTVLRRVRVLERAKQNHRSLGYLRRVDYLRDLAREEGITVKTIFQWESLYRKGGLAALANKRPGPPPSGHVSMRTWMKTWVERDWVWGKLTKVQCYRSLVNRVEQLDPQHKKYHIPSETTVSRFIRDLGAFLHAYREGPEAVKRVFKGVYRAMSRNAHVLSEYCPAK